MLYGMEEDEVTAAVERMNPTELARELARARVFRDLAEDYIRFMNGVLSERLLKVKEALGTSRGTLVNDEQGMTVHLEGGGEGKPTITDERAFAKFIKDRHRSEVVWHFSVDDEDDAEAVARLLGVGVPEETVRTKFRDAFLKRCKVSGDLVVTKDGEVVDGAGVITSPLRAVLRLTRAAKEVIADEIITAGKMDVPALPSGQIRFGGDEQ